MGCLRRARRSLASMGLMCSEVASQRVSKSACSEGFVSYVTLLVTEDDGVRTITLNRPERRNAMTPKMQDELIAAMNEAAAGDCRVVVFAGRARDFARGSISAR